MTAAELSAKGSASVGVGERQLSDLEADRFEDMLRSLTAERTSICEVSGSGRYFR